MVTSMNFFYGLVLDPSQKAPIWASLALTLIEC